MRDTMICIAESMQNPSGPFRQPLAAHEPDPKDLTANLAMS